MGFLTDAWPVRELWSKDFHKVQQTYSFDWRTVINNWHYLDIFLDVASEAGPAVELLGPAGW